MKAPACWRAKTSKLDAEIIIALPNRSIPRIEVHSVDLHLVLVRGQANNRPTSANIPKGTLQNVISALFRRRKDSRSLLDVEDPSPRTKVCDAASQDGSENERDCQCHPNKSSQETGLILRSYLEKTSLGEAVQSRATDALESSKRNSKPHQQMQKLHLFFATYRDFMSGASPHASEKAVKSVHAVTSNALRPKMSLSLAKSTAKPDQTWSANGG